MEFLQLELDKLKEENELKRKKFTLLHLLRFRRTCRIVQ